MSILERIRRLAAPRGGIVASSWRGRAAAIVISCAGMAVGMPAFGQVIVPPGGEARPMAAPELAPAAAALLDAPYLTPDEAKEKRIFHGVWSESDLDTPERAARAALLRGAYLDPALDATDAAPMDSAEALVARGEYQKAIVALDRLAAPERGGARAVRIRAEALEMQGKLREAVATGEPVLARFIAGRAGAATPADVVETVRLLHQRVRLRGPATQDAPDQLGGAAAADFHAMMDILGAIRTKKDGDRLYWPAMLVEAELLYSKDNGTEAQQALAEVLTLNPACARAWAMMGRMAVDAFDFGAAGRIAARLDELASNPAPFTRVAEGETAPEESLRTGVVDGSPLGAAIRIRALLRQTDAAAAREALAPVLARFPGDARLRALECAIEAVRFEFEKARELLKKFDEAFPGSPLAVYEVGKALSEARQYDEAAGFLTDAYRMNPFAPEPLIELGLLGLQAGKDELALESLEKAFALDPFNLRADNSLRLVRELMSYDRLESEHFIVRYKGGAEADPGDAVLAHEMLPLMEQMHAVVTGSQPGGLDHQPTDSAGRPRKTIIDLMPDHQWFGVRIAGMPAIHTIAASTGPVVAMEAPRKGANHLGTYDWVRVVRHEYSHTVSLSRTKNRIPHWFTEAAAVYLELAPRDDSTCKLLAAVLRADRLFDFNEINVAFVRPRRPSDRAQAYAQGHWMYEFIITRWGGRAPLELMDQYAQGVREEAAFGSVLGMSRAEFLEEFKAWARGQVIKWGLELPAGEPTLPALLMAEALGTADSAKKAEIDAGLAETARAGAAAMGEFGESAAGGAASEPDVPEPDKNAPEQPERPAAATPPAGASDNPDWEVDLPEPTPEMVSGWLEAHPKNPDLLEITVDAAVAVNKGRATIEIAPLLERFAEARPVEPKPHRLLAKMYLDLAEGTPPDADAGAKAIPHLEYLDQREQKMPAYAMALAKRYAAVADWAKASAKAERAVQLAPYDARPRELAAAVAVQSGELATAERHILALTKLEPDREIHKQRLEAVRKKMGR